VDEHIEPGDLPAGEFVTHIQIEELMEVADQERRTRSLQISRSY